MFHGINVHHRQHYIKLNCLTCITKIRKGRGWGITAHKTKLQNPMNHKHSQQWKVEHIKVPTDTIDAKTMQVKMGLQYIQIIGKRLFVTIT